MPASIASFSDRRDRPGIRRCSRCWQACASVRSPHWCSARPRPSASAARVPGLITGTRDAFVVALYLGGFFGISMAAASLIVSLLVYWLAGTNDRSVRHTRTSRGTGGRRAGHRPVRRLSHAVVADRHRRTGLVFTAVDAFRPYARRRDEPPPGACRHCRHAAQSCSRRQAARPMSRARPPPRSSARTTIASAAIVFGVAALLFTWTSSAERRQTAGGEAITVVPIRTPRARHRYRRLRQPRIRNAGRERTRTGAARGAGGRHHRVAVAPGGRR